MKTLLLNDEVLVRWKNIASVKSRDFMSYLGLMNKRENNKGIHTVYKEHKASNIVTDWWSLSQKVEKYRFSQE